MKEALSERMIDAQDHGALHSVLARYVETWNRHDVAEWGQLFTEDVDYVNRAGGWWQDNQANVDGHQKIHTALAKGSTFYRADVEKVCLLSPEIALVHAKWTMSGVARKNGEFTGILSLILVKRDGAWLIRAAQNTVREDTA